MNVTQEHDRSATRAPCYRKPLASRARGGSIRIGGYISETGTVAIAGSPARMTTATNFVGELPAQADTNVFTVTATDVSGNAITNWYQLTVSGNGLPTTFTYDKAGNLLSKATTNQSMTFGWDGADRCVAITNGAERTTIAYDGMNRWSRITEYSNATLVADFRFVWNGTSLAEKRDGTGTNVITRYYAGGFWQQGTNYYYVTDHLGSIKAVTDTSGTVVARFEYDPYGRRVQTFGTLQVDYGFAGLFEHKSELKLAVWRLYDPSTGRWLSRDPIREEGGWNVYAYCGGNPVCYIDPTGLVRWGQFAKGVGAFASGIVMMTAGASSSHALIGIPVLISGVMAFQYGIGNMVAAFAEDAESAKRMEEYPASLGGGIGRIAGYCLNPNDPRDGEVGQTIGSLLESTYNGLNAFHSINSLRDTQNILDATQSGLEIIEELNPANDSSSSELQP